MVTYQRWISLLIWLVLDIICKLTMDFIFKFDNMIFDFGVTYLLFVYNVHYNIASLFASNILWCVMPINFPFLKCQFIMGFS